MLGPSPPTSRGSELARFRDAASLEDELENPMVSLSSSAGTEGGGGGGGGMREVRQRGNKRSREELAASRGHL